MKDHENITPARLSVGRAGTRPPTSAWLEFRADHASAKDAVASEMTADFIQYMSNRYGAVLMQTNCLTRSEFINFPPRGKICSGQTLERIAEECFHGPDVQIVVSDGLSAKAVEVNVPDLLPILQDGLKMDKLKLGTVVLVKYGRVAIGDPVAHKLGARLVINLIGERPGLSCAESLSAYITFNPGPQTISSDRTVVSNIHRQGTPPLEAGAFIVKMAKKILKLQVSGVRLQQADDCK